MRRARAPVPHTVVGYDLSIRSAGVVVLRSDWRPGEKAPGKIMHAMFSAEEGWEDGESFVQLANEIVGFASSLCTGMDSDPRWSMPPIAIFSEGYAYNRARFNPVQFARLVELASLVKYFTREWLEEPVRTVTEGQWKKLLLGFAKKKGVDPKAVAQERIRKMYPSFKSGDECDALGIASWGRSELGLSALTFV